MAQMQRILHPSMRITLTEVSLELMVCAELGFCIELKLKTMHRARAFALGIPRLFGYINQIPGLYEQYLTKKQSMNGEENKMQLFHGTKAMNTPPINANNLIIPIQSTKSTERNIAQ